MHTHKYARAQAINVDECYGCGGFFLDSGELTEIRDHFMDDAEVAAYTQKMASTVPEYARELHATQAGEKRLQAIQKLTRFLTVRYWRSTF
jgi:Zn-finger nucleic acid-binding protein